jgi:hypothetical protein
MTEKQLSIRDRVWVWRHVHGLTTDRIAERLCMWLAWRFPRRLVLWCYTRVAADATSGAYSEQHPDSVSIMTAMDRWLKGGKK